MSLNFISQNPLLNSLKVPLCLLDSNHNIIDYNEAFNGILKYEKDLLSISYWDITNPTFNNKEEKIFCDILSGNEEESYFSELKSGTGEYIKFEITPQLFNNDLILLSLRKHNPNLLIKEAAQKSEEKYKQLINNSPVGMLILINREIIMTNQPLAQTLGYNSSQELVGKNITEFIAPEYKSLAKERLKKLTDGSSNLVEMQEEHFVDKNGNIVNVMVAGHIIEYQGKPAVLGYIFDITERKLIERELSLSEEKYKKVFYTSPDSITISRISDGMFLEVNEGFTNIVGYERLEAEGKTSYEIDIWHSKKDREKLVSALKKNGYVNNMEAMFKRKNGEIIYNLISVSLITIQDEQCLLTIARDITEIKETQLKLEESEERFRSMFENVNAVMLLMDPDTGKIVDANKAACEFYGYDHKTMVEKINITDINSEISPEKQYEIRKSVLKGNKHFFFKHKLSNGQLRYVEVYVGMLVLAKKQTIYSVIHDITERRITEEENIKLTEAVRQSPVSIIITDIEGRIEYVNKKFIEVSGYSESEVIGKNPRILKSGHTKQDEYTYLWKSIMSGKTWKGEFLNKSKNGNYFWESVAITPIKNSENNITHFLAVKEDITEDKQKEEYLLEAKEKAELSDKLKSEFLAQMSHEIRTPINVILSFSSLLKSEFVENVDEDTATIFNSIESSGKRIIRTIDLIINMSELQSGSYEAEPKHIDLISKVFDPLLHEYDILAKKKGLKLSFEANLDDAELYVDEYSTSQIFSNLLDNAIKYTPNGEVKIKVFKDDQARISVEVKDTGIGISKKYLPELFRPFSQEEQGYTRRYEGNGLGLAIVKKYCEINNADIRVRSRKGKGTTFTVKFLDNVVSQQIKNVN